MVVQANMINSLLYVFLALPNVPHLKIEFAVSESLIKEIMAESNVVVQVSTFNGRMWMRMSANFYNTKQDFEILKAALIKKLRL